MKHKELKTKVGKKASQIWDAYEEVLAEFKALEKSASITATAETAKIENAIKAAEEVDVEATAATLKSLADGLRTAKSEFEEVQMAIGAAKTELENVHKVQAEADSLVAMVETKDRLVKERTATAAEIISDAEDRAAQIRQEAAEEAQKTLQETEDAAAEAEKSRKRAQSEWMYEFERKKKMQLDEVGDIIAKKLREVKDREEEVAEREVEADAKDKEIADLKTTIAQAEADLEAKLDKAREEGKKKAEQSAHFHKQISDKAHEGELAVLQSTNAALKERLLELQTRLVAAEEQVSKAGERVTEIATTSLKSQGDAATISKVAEVAAASGGKK